MYKCLSCRIYYTVLWYYIIYYTVLYYIILYYSITILYYTIQYYTISYYIILCYTMLYYAILYYTILGGARRVSPWRGGDVPGRRLGRRRERGSRRGTNGVSTNGGTAMFMFLTGTFGDQSVKVFQNLSILRTFFPYLSKLVTFAATPLVLTPFVRSQGSRRVHDLRPARRPVVCKYIHVYIYIYMYIYIHTCIYIYIYM